MGKLLAISKNTFIETIRQPIYITIIIATLLLFIISPSLSVLTMSDNIKFLREIDLSTLFLATLFIAVFSSCGAVAEEIENKTIITVVTKPIPRPVFVLAKFLGVAFAVLVAHYICTIAYLMTMRHGVLDHVDDPHDWTVIATGAFCIFAAFSISAFMNYTYDYRFCSTAIILLAVLGTMAMIFLTFFDSQWTFNPAENGFKLFDIYASVLLLFASIIIVALAVAFSARFNIAITLSACMGIFLLGLISDYTFGRFADTNLIAKIFWFIVPNLQVFWISDAIYEESNIPIKYIFIGLFYSFCYTVGILSLAISLFQKKQVG